MNDKRLAIPLPLPPRILRRGVFLMLLSLLCVAGIAPQKVAAGDDGWWGSVCDGFKTWRRHVRRSHQEAHRRLYYPKYEPHFAGNYGYFETEWGVFPCDYGFVSAGSLIVHPSPASYGTAPAAASPGHVQERVPMAPPAVEPPDSYLPPAPPQTTPQGYLRPRGMESPRGTPASAELPILIPLTRNQPEDVENPVVEDLSVEDLFVDDLFVDDLVADDHFVAPAGFAELAPFQPGPRQPDPRDPDEPAWRPSAERPGIIPLTPLSPQLVLEPQEGPGFRILSP